MNPGMPLVQSSSGKIHAADCDRIAPDTSDHDDLWAGVPIQRDEIHAIGRYSRCDRCDPDVPEYMARVAAVPKKAGELAQCDVGRVSILGTIVVIIHGAHGVQVTFDDGTERIFVPSEHLDLLTRPTVAPPNTLPRL